MATIAEQITALREKRANIDIEQRAALDKAADENRGLNTEEKSADDRLTAEYEEVSDQLRRLERQVARDAELRAAPVPAAGADEDEPAADTRSRRETLGTDEYRSAMESYLRGGRAGLSAEERSALQAGVSADGGVTVAEFFRSTLIEKQREFSAIREWAEVITTDHGGKFHLPRVASDANAVTIPGEGVLIPDDAESFDEVQMGAWNYRRMTKASDESVDDLGFDVAGFVSRRLSEDISLVQGAHFAIGTGISQPVGLVAAAAVGKTTAAPTVFTADDVFGLIYAVSRPYRINGRLLANDQSIGVLRMLKDSTGQYLWQPGMKDGEPDRFAGYPVSAEPFVPTIAASAKVMAFGDIFRAYAIRDAGTMEIRYLVERFADTGQVAWRGSLRSDGQIKDVNAVKTLQMHA